MLILIGNYRVTPTTTSEPRTKLNIRGQMYTVKLAPYVITPDA